MVYNQLLETYQKDTINVNEFNVFMKEKKLLDSSLSTRWCWEYLTMFSRKAMH